MLVLQQIHDVRNTIVHFLTQNSLQSDHDNVQGYEKVSPQSDVLPFGAVIQARKIETSSHVNNPDDCQN